MVLLKIGLKYAVVIIPGILVLCMHGKANRSGDNASEKIVYYSQFPRVEGPRATRENPELVAGREGKGKAHSKCPYCGF